MTKFLLILDVSSIIKWFYSPDIHPFSFISALNPDCSICMNGRYWPRLSQIPGLCFAEDTIVPYKYFLSNLVIIINPSLIFVGGVRIC